MINPFTVAEKLWNEIKELQPEHKTDEIVVAILVRALVNMHGEGYRNAKTFYQDKPAGWGKESAESSPKPESSTNKVWSNSQQKYVEGDLCHKCGKRYADIWCCSTAMGGS